MTIDIVVRREPANQGRALHQTVSRTAARIHIAADDRREWLFERNVIDPRRVSAALIDHTHRIIVLHEESDLRMVLGIRGWADVLALGFDSESLTGYQRTQDVRIQGGITFSRYTRGADRRIGEVWWSDEQALPSSFVVAEKNRVIRFSIERVRPRADANLLGPPEARFPKYRVYDLAGWLERD